MSLPAVECTFCGASPSHTKVIISGPPSARAGGVFICDECVGICVEIVAGSTPAALPEIAKAPLRMIARDIQYASRVLGNSSELFEAWRETSSAKAATLCDVAANISAIANAIGPPELDRAVQKAVAEAFGQMIDALVLSAANRAIGNEAWADIQQSAVIQSLKQLHTAFGGRIPDEVSQ